MQIIMKEWQIVIVLGCIGKYLKPYRYTETLEESEFDFLVENSVNNEIGVCIKVWYNFVKISGMV